MEIDVASGVLWGFVASTAMIVILQGSQSLGYSRLNLPFLVGAMFTIERHRAMVYGLALYLIGGWLFAFLYLLIFEALGHASWWLGAVLAILHGLALLTLMQLLPHVHPRVASEYDGPSSTRRLEPPGPFGLNYGRHTPLTTLVAHLAYGLILGTFYVTSG